mgnify:CR=1 FL=1
MDAWLKSALASKRVRERAYIALWAVCVLAMLLSMALGYLDLEPGAQLLFTLLPGVFAGAMVLVSLDVVREPSFVYPASGNEPEAGFASATPNKLRKPPRPPSAA